MGFFCVFRFESRAGNRDAPCMVVDSGAALGVFLRDGSPEDSGGWNHVFAQAWAALKEID